MIKRKAIFLMWVGLLAMLTSYSQTKVLPKFWERIEVGTNLIPMVDSLTLQPSNLMVKYYYGKNHDNAFRVNLLYNDFTVEVEKGPNASPHYLSKVSVEIGHMWSYSLLTNVYLYHAIDLKFTNSSNNVYYTDRFDHIYHWNEYYTNLSAGVKYNFYKKLSIELETTLSFGLQRFFKNYSVTYNAYQQYYINYYKLRYYPINCLTLNYNF